MATTAFFLSEPLTEPVNASSHLPAHPPLDRIPHPSEADQPMLGLDSSESSFISSAHISLNSQPQQSHSSNTSPPTNTTHSASSSSQPHSPLSQALATTAVAPAQQSTTSQSMLTGQLGSWISAHMQHHALGATAQSNSPSNVSSVIHNVHLDPKLFRPFSTLTPPPRDPQEQPSQNLLSSFETGIKPSLDLDTLIQYSNFYPPEVKPSIQLDLPSGSPTADQAMKHHPHLTITPLPTMPTTPPASSSALPLSKVVATPTGPSIPATSQSNMRTPSGHPQHTQTTLGDVRLPQVSSWETASAPGKDAPNGIQNSKTSSSTTTTTQNAASQSTTPVGKVFHPKEWKKRLADIRYYLDQMSISPKTASMKLGEILFHYRVDKDVSGKDWSTVPLDGRLEVMLAIKYNGASPPFLRAWIRSKKCLAVINCWLQDAVDSILEKNHDPAHFPSNSAGQELPERTAILLHILQLLRKSPITIEIMKAHRFGKCIAKINSHAQEFPDYITGLSHVIESQWRQKVAAARSKQLAEDALLNSKSHLPSTQSGPTSNAVIAAEAPKPLTSAPVLKHQHSASTPTAAASRPRTPNPTPTLTNGERATKPHTKTPLSNLNPNRPPVAESRKRQLEARSSPNEAKKRKAILPVQPTGDTLVKGLFGRSDQMKLPTFTTNRDVPSTMFPKPAPSASPTSTFNPFAQAMSMLMDRPVYNEEFNDFPTVTTTSTKTNNPRKPAKRVRFRSEEELCQVKIVERLVYEGDEHELPVPLDGIRMSDAHEGRYLHQASRTLDEEMEWESPKDVIVTSETERNLETSPLVSLEASIQEARERERESVSYLNEQQIPHMPQEAPLDSPHGEDVPPAKLMKLGGKLLADPEVVNALSRVHPEHYGADADANEDVTSTQAISSLISQLWHESGSSPPVPLTSASQLGTTDITNQTCHVTDHNQPVPSSILSGPGYPHHGLTRCIPDRSERDLPPHLNPLQAYLSSSAVIILPSSKKKRKRNRNKNKNKNFEQVQEPPLPPRCRYGSDCSFGQNCRFRHDHADWA